MTKTYKMTDAQRSILIIDDDNRNIFALTAVLKAKGFTVKSAMPAEDGIDILTNDQGIKIVLIDIMMPDMDGFETISEIRKNEDLKDTKLIAVTAQAMVGDREKCLAAGADDYVSKPIDIDLLMTKLNELK